MLRVGMLTSGGDCQSLNATMRGVAKGLYHALDEVKILGIEDGYSGLIHGNAHKMMPEDFSGILNLGGTIIGTSRQPFKQISLPDENGKDKVDAMIKNYKKWSLDCLVVLGGNGTHKTANLLSKAGLNVITLPKTIDNDLWGTDVTFGFQSAVDVATGVIDNIHTTAASHGRVFIVELMGHKVGWLTLYAGLAGGADIILLPEIPYDMEVICRALKKREKQGKRFSILAVAEGAISKERAALSKKELKKELLELKYPSISYEIGEQIERKTGQEVRITIPGHMQRGGNPCSYDRVLSTRLGAVCAKSILDKHFGCMIGFENGNIIRVPLDEVAGKLKMIEKNHPMIEEAKSLGISFGDI